LEVLLSPGGRSQESRAQPKKSAPKKKTVGIVAKQPSKKNPALIPSQPTIGSNSDDMDQHMTCARTKIAVVKNNENEVIESPIKEPAHPVRKSVRIMNQFKVS